MALPHGKRPRSDGKHRDSIAASATIPEEDSCFAPLVAWVTARGGFVHPALFLDAHRTLRATTRLPAGTLLMRIPAVTAAVDDTDDVTAMEPCLRAEHALAWYLAQKPEYLQPYWSSLPPDAIDLPRLWPPEVLQQLLTGSPVLRYIQKTQQEQLPSQYRAASARRNGAPRCPSWEDYRWAHALVTSRAFSDNAAICLVPVLDLCNHSRGKESKNVAYTVATAGGAVVEVTTSCDMAPHEALRITYGAKPNSVLLVNYGFALRHNIEPDGSSNDVLELYPKTGEEAVPVTVLRTGPPSYTYGCFTTALQSFYLDEGTAVTDHRDEEERELDDFLNECEADDVNDTEQEEEEHDSADEAYEDLLYQVPVPSITDPTNGSTKQQELTALRKFRQYLVQLADAYTLPKQPNWSLLLQDETDPSRDVYAARLIGSELRILQFYIGTTERLERRLDAAATISVTPPLVPLDPDDVVTMDRHMEELITAYRRLRHGEDPGLQ